MMYCLITIKFQTKKYDRKRKRNQKTKKKESRTQSNNSHNVIGDVGYMFRKRFDTGWFGGEVTEICLGAANGKDRRVVYSNGDAEDLSVQDLVKLSLMDLSLKKTEKKKK